MKVLTALHQCIFPRQLLPPPRSLAHPRPAPVPADQTRTSISSRKRPELRAREALSHRHQVRTCAMRIYPLQTTTQAWTAGWTRRGNRGGSNGQ